MRILEFPNRKFQILSAVVKRYVLTGDPVGSKSVCEDLELSFSSATVRSEMADLADFGYLFQPHISSGRVPSHQGYRLYINKLMTEKPLSQEEKNLINGMLGFSSVDPESLLSTAVKVLSDITDFTAVVTTPPSAESRVRDIQFVMVGRQSAMIVLIISNGMIKNKLFRCDYDLSPDMLRMFGKILNEKFRGEPLASITPEFVNFLVGNNEETALLWIPVLDVLMKAAKEACEVEVKIYGQKNLLSIPGVTPETVINIFDFLESREKVLDLLNLTDNGINFIVGEENTYKELKNASVVSTHYHIGGKSGAIGIVGPTRMDYATVAAQLQYVAAIMGVLLGRILEN